MRKISNWLLYVVSTCLIAVMAVVSINWTSQEATAATWLEDALKTTSAQDICDLDICNADKGDTGSENAFDFLTEQAVAPGIHKSHAKGENFEKFNSSAYDIDIRFSIEIKNWGADGWIGFRTSGNNEIRLYNDRLEAEALVDTDYQRAKQSVRIKKQVEEGWHTVRMILTDGDESTGRGNNIPFAVCVYIDGVETSFLWIANDWANKSPLRFINNTNAAVNVMSSNASVALAKKTVETLAKNAYMSKGASIRMDEAGDGIRFETNFLVSDFEKANEYCKNGTLQSISFGTMIFPIDYLTEKETIESLRLAGKVADCKSSGIYQKNSTETISKFWGALVDIQNYNYTRGFLGVGYFMVTDNDGNESYYYVDYDISNVRSFYSVAKATYTQLGETSLKAHLDGVVIIDMNGAYKGGLGSSVYTPAYTVAYANGTVTIISTAEIKTVIVFVNETDVIRLSNAYLSFGDGNKTVTFAYDENEQINASYGGETHQFDLYAKSV